MDHSSWDWEAYGWCTREITQLYISLCQSGTFWAETVLTLRSNLHVWFSLALQQTRQIQGHRHLSWFWNPPVSGILWCSCLPRRPNCCVSSHHIVWIKDSGFYHRVSRSSKEYLPPLRTAVELCLGACRGQPSEAVSRFFVPYSCGGTEFSVANNG